MTASPIDQAETLTRGMVVRDMRTIRYSISQLDVLLQATIAGNPEAGAVIGEIKRSISRASCLLNCVNVGIGTGHPLFGDQRSGEVSSKRRKDNPAAARRGGSRRSALLSSVKVVLSKSLVDGQTWRKYGQKHIQNSEHPRSYFRCTHKHDQGCMAQKQAQFLDHDPTTYVITYRGEHTCREPVMVSHIISSACSEDTNLVSFGSSIHYGNQEAEVLAPPKQERDEDRLTNASSSLSPNYLHLPAAEMPPVVTPTAGHAPDHCDATHGFQTWSDLYFTGRYFEDFEDFEAFDELF